MAKKNDNNVILAELKGIKALFNEKFLENTKEHKEMKDKVDLTNGRVTSLELWRSFLFGAWAVILLIIIPIILYLIKQVL